MELGLSVELMNFEMQYAYFSIRHLLSVWVVGSCINAWRLCLLLGAWDAVTNGSSIGCFL